MDSRGNHERNDHMQFFFKIGHEGRRKRTKMSTRTSQKEKRRMYGKTRPNYARIGFGSFKRYR